MVQNTTQLDIPKIDNGQFQKWKLGKSISDIQQVKGLESLSKILMVVLPRPILLASQTFVFCYCNPLNFKMDCSEFKAG
jgi:hypothetical protein